MAELLKASAPGWWKPMEELEKASGLRLWDTGTPRGSRSSSHALLGYLRTIAGLELAVNEILYRRTHAVRLTNSFAPHAGLCNLTPLDQHETPSTAWYDSLTCGTSRGCWRRRRRSRWGASSTARRCRPRWRGTPPGMPPRCPAGGPCRAPAPSAARIGFHLSVWQRMHCSELRIPATSYPYLCIMPKALRGGRSCFRAARTIAGHRPSEAAAC